jgi:hypothetical protein
MLKNSQHIEIQKALRVSYKAGDNMYQFTTWRCQN